LAPATVNDMKFSWDDIAAVRRMVGILWNVYNFAPPTWCLTCTTPPRHAKRWKARCAPRTAGSLSRVNSSSPRYVPPWTTSCTTVRRGPSWTLSGGPSRAGTCASSDPGHGARKGPRQGCAYFTLITPYPPSRG
jgi:hypothetical protein